MTDPLVLSSSSISTFLRCGQQWEFAYVYGYKSPPSIRQVIGIATHQAIETNMLHKMDTAEDLPVDEVLDAFSDSYDVEMTEWEPSDDPETPDAGKDSGVKLVTMAREDVLPPIQPVAVELPVQMTIQASEDSPEIPFSGVIDLIDSKGRVRDWKTSKRKPTYTAGIHILQMTGYALGYRQATGEQESEVVLDHLVRTKLPEYVPVASGGPVETPAIREFARIATNVSAQINAGNFVPNGLMSGACSWCGYQSICPAYKEFRA